MHYNVTMKRVCAPIVAVEQQYYTTRVCVALGIRYATRMRHTVICGLSGSPIFFHFYLINAMIFGGEKSYWNTKRILVFSANLSETFPILTNERDVMINVR